MELKTARLTLLIDPNKKAAFERLCAQLDLTASQVVRQLIRDYLAQHGVSYVPSGQKDAAQATGSPRTQRPKREAPHAAKSAAPRSAAPRSAAARTAGPRTAASPSRKGRR